MAEAESWSRLSNENFAASEGVEQPIATTSRREAIA
jgi:hypothetical protein